MAHDNLQVQWYPGHMTKTKRMLTAQMGLIDVVVEILDARVPLSSRNPDIDSLAKNKKRVLVLNKADLADPNITARWEEHFRKLGFFTLPLSAKENDKKKSGMAQFSELLRIIMKEKAESQRKRGRINVPTRAMIVGIPNVGKSTFINLLSGRASTATADRPGVTRGRQWIKVDANIDMMDTPGVLWPKFEDPEVGLKLACTGAVSDNVVDKIALAESLINMLVGKYPTVLEARYKIDLEKCKTITEHLQYKTCSETKEGGGKCFGIGEHFPPPNTVSEQVYRRQILTDIGEARGFKMKGGVIDIERAAIILLDEFRGGKLGRISLERPV